MQAQSIAAILAIGVLGGTAAADVILTLTYDDLAGEYDASSQLFTASAVNDANLQSSGDVSKLFGAGGNAVFGPGFVSSAPANFVLDISVVFGGGGVVTGAGSFTSTDADGDTITGDLSGDWFDLGNGFIAFNGVVENVTVSLPNNAAFDGTSSGSWSGDGMPDVLSGAIVELVFGAEAFFGDQDFAGASTGVNIQLVPAPAGAGLLGVGALALTRRRRRG